MMSGRSAGRPALGEDSTLAADMVAQRAGLLRGLRSTSGVDSRQHSGRTALARGPHRVQGTRIEWSTLSGPTGWGVGGGQCRV